jgi:alpha-1,6-mannosyltransferase
VKHWRPIRGVRWCLETGERRVWAPEWAPAPGERVAVVYCGLLGIVAALFVGLAEPPLDGHAESAAARSFGDLFASPNSIAVSCIGLAGVFAMVLCWIWLIQLTRRLRLAAGVVTAIAVSWVIPLVVAGPIISADVYAYGAIGQLLDRGFDPYRVGAAALGSGPFLRAMDPNWAHAPAPYGPLGLLVLGGSVHLGEGHFGPTLVILRALIAATAVAAVTLAVAQAPPAKRPVAIALIGASPVVTLGLIGSAHLDAFAVALAAAAAFAWRTDRTHLAIGFATLATAVKAPFAILLTALVIAAVSHAAHGRRLRQFAVLTAIATGGYAIPALLVAHPFGLFSALSTPYARLGLEAPSTAVAWFGGSALRWVGVAGGKPLQDAIYGIVQGIGVIGVVLATVRARRQDPVLCAAVALAMLALSSPLLHLWYFAWPLILIGRVCWRRRVLAWVTAIGAYAAVMEVPRPKGPSAILVPTWLALAGGAASFAWLAIRQPRFVMRDNPNPPMRDEPCPSWAKPHSGRTARLATGASPPAQVPIQNSPPV